MIEGSNLGTQYAVHFTTIERVHQVTPRRYLLEGNQLIAKKNSLTDLHCQKYAVESTHPIYYTVRNEQSNRQAL